MRPEPPASFRPTIAERLGRRVTLALYFVVMFLSIATGFGYVFYLSAHALEWFWPCLFFLGIGGANFGQFVTPMQASMGFDQSLFGWAYTARIVGSSVSAVYVGRLLCHG